MIYIDRCFWHTLASIPYTSKFSPRRTVTISEDNIFSFDDLNNGICIFGEGKNVFIIADNTLHIDPCNDETLWDYRSENCSFHPCTNA